MEYRIKFRAAPPARLATISGDVVHNLRSALDLLWCQLVQANGKDIAKSDHFVIAEHRLNFEATFKGVNKRIPLAARDVVAALKPYREGTTNCGNSQFRIEIALDEPPVVECEPVLPLLTQLGRAVNDVIELFAPILAE